MLPEEGCDVVQAEPLLDNWHAALEKITKLEPLRPCALTQHAALAEIGEALLAVVTEKRCCDLAGGGEMRGRP